MKIVAVTGSLYSGKTTLTDVFRQNGAYVIDASECMVEVCKRGLESHRHIREYFGSFVMDETSLDINFEKLSLFMAKDLTYLPKFTRSIYKPMAKRMLEHINRMKAENTYPIIVVDTPIMLEPSVVHLCNTVVNVNTDVNERIKRMMLVLNLTQAEATKIIKSYESYDEVRENIDFTIDNSMQLDFAAGQVKNCMKFITSEF